MGAVVTTVRACLAGVIALCLLNIVACSKLRDVAQKLQPGQAFLESQIPPGLSPQYYPPEGFVWGGYRSGTLPEARYGVASPPINPRAQVLILADADYPAETYFETMHQLLNAGYGVWLLEAPGQGGSGHYLMQGNAIYIGNYHDAWTTTAGFIKDIIHPTDDKPLFVIGSGYSAIQVLALSTELKDKTIVGFVGFNPYTGEPISKGQPWHRDAITAGYWGAIAQDWEDSNPDLRLRIKSEAWQKEMKKAFTELDGLHLPLISLRSSEGHVSVFEDKSATSNDLGKASALCAHVPKCEMEAILGPQTLGNEMAGYIKGRLPEIR